MPAPKPATPLPFEVHGCSLYQADDWQNGTNNGGQRIGQTYADDSDEMPTAAEMQNATYIAHACNAYPRLVECLQIMRSIAGLHLAADARPEWNELKKCDALLRELGEDAA